MSDNIYTETVREDRAKGIYARIIEDTEPMDPRKDYDHLGTMVCCHRSYDLGDVRVTNDDAFWDHLEDVIRQTYGNPRCAKCGQTIELSYRTWEHFDESQMYGGGDEELDAKMEALDEDHAGVLNLDQYMVWLPLDLLDHSGLHMNAGQGFIGDEARWDTSSVGIIYVTLDKLREEYPLDGDRERKAKGLKALQTEVHEYDQYLSGDVWGYEVTHGEVEVDGRWDIYGRENAEQEATEAFEHYLDRLMDEDLSERYGDDIEALNMGITDGVN